MPVLRQPAPDDLENSSLRKILENDTATISGAQSVAIRSDTATGTPRVAVPDDDKNTLLRKILENQVDVIGGRLIYHLS
jgi:hypothetical protein